MRRIWVDGLFLYEHFQGSGINRYLSSLLSEIELATRGRPALQTVVLVHPATAANRHALISRPGFELRPFALMRFRRAWRLGAAVPLMRKLGARILFLPSPVPVHFKPDRLAVTVHDVIPLLYPSSQPCPYGAFLWHAYFSSLRRADLIFTDSEHSKSDMVGRFEVPPDKIVVTYLGYDSNLFNAQPLDSLHKEKTLKRYGITQPYVLHVGTTERRKNLVRLARAYQLLCERRKSFSFQLVLCGRIAPDSEDLQRAVSGHKDQGRVAILNRVPDDDLSILYKSAAGFAMPSIYEGFGLPLLEAMASGVPVMSSNRSSLPEIGGDAVLYFNPESVEEISHAMERLLSDTTLRKELTQRGLQRAQRFSWQSCARITLGALKNL
jgi:glycosyltransferase involved in cell wall biosynthesis